MSTVAVRAMEPTREDLERYAACCEHNGSARTVAALDWRLLRNPVGRLWVELAVAERAPGQLSVVATYGAQPVRARLAGRPVLAIQAIDAITDEEYRRRGLFGAMAGNVARRAAAGGAAFVYGFPNGGASARGHFGRLGWTALDPVPFVARPLRTGFMASRLLKGSRFAPDLPLPLFPARLRRGAELRPVTRFGPEFDELWESFASAVGVCVERDSAYLNWRIVDKPGEDYSRVAIHEQGRVQGFVAWVLKSGKHGGNVGYIVEMVHRPGRVDVGRALLRHALSAMARERADLVLAWNFRHAPNHPAYVRSGFLPFPERLRPIELHVGARTLAGAGAAAVTSRRQWYLSYCDSDTV